VFIALALEYFLKLRRSGIWHIPLLRSLRKNPVSIYKHPAPKGLRAQTAAEIKLTVHSFFEEFLKSDAGIEHGLN
jgi:hypothetical protein